MNKNRAVLNICAIVAASFVFAVCPHSLFSGEVPEPDKYPEKELAARVNGQALYWDQIKPLLDKEMEAFRKFGSRSINPAATDRLRKKAVATAIENELLRQESEKVNVPDMERRVEERLAELKKSYPSGDEYRERLKSGGKTEEELRELLRASIRLEEYLKILGISNPEISEEEIREFYESSPGAFVREEMIEVRHILIQAEAGSGEAGKEAARQTIVKIRDEVIRGKDFAEAAKEHSQDAYAARGGELGYIKRGFMPKEFDEAAFALGNGEVSPVVETEHGFHIIKVEDRRPGGRASLEELHDFIEKYLRERASKKKFDEHVAELKKKALIEIPLTEGKGSGGAS